MDNNNSNAKYGVENSKGFVAAQSFLTGLLLGTLAGSLATFLMAPQSGKKTRLQILQKGKALRKQTAEAVDDGVDQLRDKAREVSTSIHEHAEELQQQGQQIIDQQKDRWSPVVEAGTTALKN